MSTKRSWKLQEFVAHGANVNCLALGHKTGRVMVTGGDDKKVNLWTIGKPNCIMSLSGHTSPVEAVRFANAEEMVVAGSMSGALKLWDLEQAKIVRTLTGHKANIRSLDFHPYGDFVASGSLDTNVKLWDIRRKGCIFTYKGHTNCVNDLKFSPDGRWIASAGEDMVVKIWDLAAGKLLVDLKQHTGPITSIEFHPSEYLLASGSSDRTIRFWELEKFQCVDSTDFDNSGIRTICFHPDGACIFGGSQDILKIYGWEPCQCFDALSMGWGKVTDIAMAQTQMIGATFNQTNVSTFVVDLSRVAPVGEVPAGSPATPLTASQRRLHERPTTTSTKQQLTTTSNRSMNRQVSNSSGKMRTSTSTNSYNSINKKRQSQNECRVQCKPALRRSSSMLISNDSSPNDSFVKTKRPILRSNTVVRKSGVGQSRRAVSCCEFSTDVDRNGNKILKKADIPVVIMTSKPLVRPAEEPEESLQPSDDPGDDASSTADVKDPQEYDELFRPKTKLAQSPPKKLDPFPAPKDDDVSQLAQNFRAVPSALNKPTPSITTQSRHHVPPAAPTSELHMGLDPKDFMPAKQSQPTALGDYDALSAISKGHSAMSALLTNRSKNLQIVRAMWSSGNVKTALDSAIQMNDQSIMVDILNVLNFRPSDWNLDMIDVLLPTIHSLMHSKYDAQLWNLDVVALLLPHIKQLVSGKYESYIHVGSVSLKLVLRNYSQIIKQNLYPPTRLGVDITGEERHRKCSQIYKWIQDIRQSIDGKQYQQGKVGSTFKEIQLLMGHLDT